jgi:hypothetical protein
LLKNNHMKDEEILDKYFRGDNNPAKRPEVRAKLKQVAAEKRNYWNNLIDEHWDNQELQYESWMELKEINHAQLRHNPKIQ